MPLNFREGQLGQISMIRYLLGAPIVDQAKRAISASRNNNQHTTVALDSSSSVRGGVRVSSARGSAYRVPVKPDEIEDNRSDVSRRVTLVQRRREVLG